MLFDTEILRLWWLEILLKNEYDLDILLKTKYSKNKNQAKDILQRGKSPQKTLGLM